jgi:membrane-bound lytic murein transglycosylase D
MTVRIKSTPLLLLAVTLATVMPRLAHADVLTAMAPPERGAVVMFPDGIGDVPVPVEEHALPGTGSQPAPVPPVVRTAPPPLFDIGAREDSKVDLASLLRQDRPATVASEYPLELNPRIRHFLERFTGARRNLIGLWLDRSGRYLGMIRDTLRRQGLPEELAFTAMIESGFNPLAVSRAGAKGMWQFMAQTARRYGLRVDDWVDERLDPEKSTVAAAAYLRDLHGQFGSWFLAQAAYNAGEMKVLRAIQLTRSTDFWALAQSQHLHDETKDFVPQIQAAALIGRNPNRYGFDVPAHQPHSLESVRVPGSTDLKRLATEAGIPPETLVTLNGELVRGVTPPGGIYQLKVPEGDAGRVRRAVDAMVRPVSRVSSHRSDVHVVRSGDTLSGIAKHYRMSLAELKQINGLRDRDTLRPGDRIRVQQH